MPVQIRRNAEISECGQYRWWLRRSGLLGNLFRRELRAVSFIMLNPSTADARIDDPTIRRCMTFAKDWGYDVLTVRNLFAYRATDPTELLKAHNPTGGERGDIELLAATSADLIIAAWGAFVPFDRENEAMKIFDGFKLHCLGLTKKGFPRHPLYVPKSAEPIPFEVRRR